jgi:hypothetical protein
LRARGRVKSVDGNLLASSAFSLLRNYPRSFYSVFPFRKENFSLAQQHRGTEEELQIKSCAQAASCCDLRGTWDRWVAQEGAGPDKVVKIKLFLLFRPENILLQFHYQAEAEAETKFFGTNKAIKFQKLCFVGGFEAFAHWYAGARSLMNTKLSDALPIGQVQIRQSSVQTPRVASLANSVAWDFN